MPVQSVSDRILAATCIAAPLFGVVAGAANPALGGSSSSQLLAISNHSAAFYVYAICILISSYLLVPAVLAIMAVIKASRPGWALAGGALTLVGALIAVGDAATELVYWQMGQPRADHGQMVALADRYDAAVGASLVYNIGGIVTILGLVLLGIGVWRSAAAPRWVGVALPVGAIANIAGFSMGSPAVLVGSYLVLLAGFVPVARALVGGRGRSVTADDAVPLVVQPTGR
jgi:hypothetical protein